MKGIAAGLMLLLVLAAGWYFMRQDEVQPVAPAVSVAPPQPVAPVEASPTAPEVQYPIEQVAVGAAPGTEAPAVEAEEAPPTLEGSAERVGKWLAAALASPLREMLLSENFVRRVVATVDNLPREKAAVRLWPVVTVNSLPVVGKQDGALALVGANEARYARHLALAESVDLDALVRGYKQLYPLFQQAYRELGYPSGNFNDRLVAVIDHLLAAPEIAPPIALVQPKVVYRFADPELESLSAGQKIMVRIGPDNARRVKARLRVLRQRLAGQL